MNIVKIDIRYQEGQYFEDQYRLLVNYALSNGCVYKDGTTDRPNPFSTDKGAVTTCHLYGTITAQFIRDHFLLDDVVHIQSYPQTTACSLHDPRFQLEIYFHDINDLDDD